MRLFLFGISAFSYWLTVSVAPRESDKIGAGVFAKCEPSAAAIEHLCAWIPFLPLPVHVSTNAQNRKVPSDIVAHVMSFKLRGKVFCRVGNGLYAASPELCFVQLAQQLSFHELVRAGNVLCGCFFIRPDGTGTLGSRNSLTSKRRIEAFLKRNPGITGAKKARQALRWVVEGAASPPEAFLAMVLGLPFRRGGFQLEGAKVNQRIKPSREARTIAGRETLVPDLLFDDMRLAVEYDSTAEHAAAAQLTRDAQKRLALEADGYKVITVTAGQICRAGEMKHIAKQAYRRRGRRFRPQSAAFLKQQEMLFRMGWSLDRYLNLERREGSV